MSTKPAQTDAATFVRPNTFTRDGGLKIKRYFTKKGVHPFDDVEWELRSAGITDEKGNTLAQGNTKREKISTRWLTQRISENTSEYNTFLTIPGYIEGTAGSIFFKVDMDRGSSKS